MLFFAVDVNPCLCFSFVEVFVEVFWERYPNGAFVPHLELRVEPSFDCGCDWPDAEELREFFLLDELDPRRVFGCGDVEARDFVRVYLPLITEVAACRYIKDDLKVS